MKYAYGHFPQVYIHRNFYSKFSYLIRQKEEWKLKHNSIHFSKLLIMVKYQLQLNFSSSDNKTQLPVITILIEISSRFKEKKKYLNNKDVYSNDIHLHQIQNINCILLAFIYCLVFALKYLTSTPILNHYLFSNDYKDFHNFQANPTNHCFISGIKIVSEYHRVIF